MRAPGVAPRAEGVAFAAEAQLGDGPKAVLAGGNEITAALTLCFAAAVHAHWRNGNGLHWGLDTELGEDRARDHKDHSAENLAVIDKLTLNFLGRVCPDVCIRRNENAAEGRCLRQNILGHVR
jgi:Transposase